jgi:hypothetical protein
MNLKIIKNRTRKRSKIHYLKTIEQLQKDNYEAAALSILSQMKAKKAVKDAQMFELVYGKLLTHLDNIYKIKHKDWEYLETIFDWFEEETGHKLQRIG